MKTIYVVGRGRGVAWALWSVSALRAVRALGAFDGFDRALRMPDRNPWRLGASERARLAALDTLEATLSEATTAPGGCQ